MFSRSVWIPLAAAALAFVAPPVPASGALYAQAAASAPAAAPQTGPVVSSRISLSDDEAALRIELDDGRRLDLALRDGDIRIDGEDVGTYRPGGALDRSWRALLQSLGGSLESLRRRLSDWDPPASSPDGERLADALRDAIPAPPAPPPVPASLADSMRRLQERIDALRRQHSERLEERVVDAEIAADVRREIRRELEREFRREYDRAAEADWRAPFRTLWRGVGSLVTTLAIYAVLVALGFGTVFFGHRYLEGVSDTVRRYPLRSGLVGLAGSFLILPAFILGLLTLVISIVGIPLVLAWVPLFPLAAGIAVLFGYLAVGHAAGEMVAERRFYGGDWFKRANSYYYVITGVGALMLLFLAASVLQMAGPWLGVVRGLVIALAVVLTWAVMTIGFGAVLLARAGVRPLPVRPSPEAEPAEVLDDEVQV